VKLFAGSTHITALDTLAGTIMIKNIASTVAEPDPVTEPETRAAMFEEVLTQHSAMISRIVLACEADPGLQRDLRQEIMLAIWSSLPNFRRASSLKTFVAGIAYNQSSTHVSRAVRRPKFSPLPDDLVCQDPLPDETADRNRRKAQMLAAVQSLPIAQKQAIVLCLEDFTFEEIGRTLGISARAAAMRCRRAKSDLARAMENSS
jgi:RNA polymerase sigma factor (sigma-70 family)